MIESARFRAISDNDAKTHAISYDFRNNDANINGQDCDNDDNEITNTMIIITIMIQILMILMQQC